MLWALTRDDGEPTVEYLVLAQDVQAGDLVGMEDFEITEMVLPDEVDAFTLFRNSAREADPRWIAQTPIREGTLALVDDYRQIEGGEPPARTVGRSLSHIDEARAMNGQASANLTVDVIGTFEETARTRTEVVARAARIVQVAPTAQERADPGGPPSGRLVPDRARPDQRRRRGHAHADRHHSEPPPGGVGSSQFSGLAARAEEPAATDDDDASADSG